VSTAKSLFLRRESDVWDSLRSQRAVLTEANERLAQRSAEVADLRLLCDELKSEAVSTRAEALSAWEQVASQAEEMRLRQLELGEAIGERDQSQSQAAEAVSRAEALRGQLAEATERLSEASTQAGTLAESLAVAAGSAQSAQAEASQQRARAEGMFCPLCEFVFVSILLLASKECCPVVCRVRGGS
jgi:DNA repair exonuclease SbcCD ATPase subunit